MILVDTHVVLWVLLSSSKLSADARNALDSARESGSGVAVSDITLWELAMLADKGRINLNASPETFLQDVEKKFVVLPISGRICVQALALPASHPKDPADRVIAATAIVEGIPLVTADRAIRKCSAVNTVW